MKSIHIKRVTLIVLIAIVFLQLLWVTGKVGTVSAPPPSGPPLLIGSSSYHQPYPFESNPTSYTNSSLVPSGGAFANAFDGNLATNVNFNYGISPIGGNGSLQLNAFNTAAPSQFAIGWIDLKISYRASGTSTTNDRYRIVYYVDPYPNAIVLQDWVTGNAAVFPAGSSGAANRPWNITEPNDGLWDWSDIADLRVRIEIQGVGTNNFQKIYLSEVWLSIYPKQLPQVGVTLQPTLVQGLPVNDYFFVDAYLYNGTNPVSNLWTFQFKIDYNPNILTAITWFTYSPFVQEFPSVINNTGGYVAIAYASFNGDTVGLTKNSPLARIYFQVKADGRSLLHFSTAILARTTAQSLTPDINDGVYTTSAIHDVAAVNVQANTTVTVLGKEVIVKVTIMNQGTYNESSIGVSAQYDSTEFGNQAVGFLGAGLTTRLTFNWNTSGVPIGLRQLKATVSLAGDQDSSNDIFTDGNVLVGHHDIAVTAVKRIYPDNIAVPENETLEVYKGTIVYINVTVSNIGNFPESDINVTAKWKGINLVIGNVTGVSVNVGTNTTTMFRWNTTEGWNFIPDRHGNPVNYTISPVEGIASPVPYEKGTDYDFTTNNDLIGGDVNITRPLLSPFAKFHFIPDTSAYTGQPVKFDASPPGESRTPNGTRIVSYKWDFGDGNITTVADPIIYHEYMSNGTYQIILMVTNNVSLTDTTTPSSFTELNVKNRNLLILNVTASPTPALLGSTITINVTVMNRGDDYELFNATTYYGNSIIQKLNSSQLGVSNGGYIKPWETAVVSFNWNTTGMAPGTYAIKAYIDPLPWESNTTDNTLMDGQIRLQWHNIALSNLLSNPAEVTVGDKVSISVTVINQGDFTETFTVAIQAGNIEAGNKTVTALVSGSSQTLDFVWDTSGITPGSYTIKAIASGVSGETKLTDNTVTGSTITVNAPPNQNILLYAIAGVAAVIIIALVLVYFLRIRKPKET